VFQELNIPYQFVSRTASDNALGYADLTQAIMDSHHLIINTTPLGMYPNVDACPEIPYSLLTVKHHLFDLVYNPAETKFLSLGKQKGASIQNGYEMLILQAEESWRIWNNLQ